VLEQTQNPVKGRLTKPEEQIRQFVAEVQVAQGVGH
jgi:hypothetical protein